MIDDPTNDKEEDVNDVLMSIRELVSQEAESHAVIEKRKQEQVVEEAKAPQPLVLGDNQRIPEGDALQNKARAEPPALLPEPIVRGEISNAKKAPKKEKLKPLVMTQRIEPLPETKPVPEVKPEPKVAEAKAAEPEVEEKKAEALPVLELKPASEAAEQKIEAPEAPEPAAMPLFSEEELRTMVSEMVREELQNEFGDRITRNIRKIVRREVLRSLDETAGDDDSIIG